MPIARRMRFASGGLTICFSAYLLFSVAAIFEQETEQAADDAHRNGADEGRYKTLHLLETAEP